MTSGAVLRRSATIMSSASSIDRGSRAATATVGQKMVGKIDPKRSVMVNLSIPPPLNRRPKCRGFLAYEMEAETRLEAGATGANPLKSSASH